MSVELKSPEIVASLKSAAEHKTGKTFGDLTGAVQALCDGYGSDAIPVLEELVVTENGEYTPRTGVDGYSKVTVNVAGSATESIEDDLIQGEPIGDYYNDRVTKVASYGMYGAAFSGEVELPNVTSIGTYGICSTKAIGVILPSVTSIAARGVATNTRMTKLSCPSVTSVADRGLYENGALLEINLPLLQTIGGRVFDGNSALTKIDFGSLVNITGDNNFNNCRALTALILRGNSVVVVGNATQFATTDPIPSGAGYIYVPSALVQAYISDSFWSTYANQIRAIEDYPEVTS